MNNTRFPLSPFHPFIPSPFHPFILSTLLLISVLFLSCGKEKENQRLMERATELCQYIPDHELLSRSKDFMTADFYAVLDTMFSLPSHEAMDHEWLYYFVTGNGGSIADFEVTAVEKKDKNHAVATVLVRQIWEDGSFDPVADLETHTLVMERVNDEWLIADFDDHKADCINYIANARKEQAVRDAISDFLVQEIGVHYKQGELCIPTLMIVAAEELDSAHALLWGDFWIDWYQGVGDTLCSVSGGNHAGCMAIEEREGQLFVTSFDEVQDGANYLPSAVAIFDKHYDLFQSMHANEEVRAAVRTEQLAEYIHRHGLHYHYYKDYGWPAVLIDF